MFALSEKPEKKRISISLMPVYVRCLDQLVEAGVFESRSEVVRDALRTLFRGFKMPPFVAKEPEESGGR